MSDTAHFHGACPKDGCRLGIVSIDGLHGPLCPVHGADTDTRHVAYVVYRKQGDVESLGMSRIHGEDSLGRREAHDLVGAYLLSLMAQGAVVNESSHRPEVWVARFTMPARDEIVVVVPADEPEPDAVSLWAETTGNWHLA